MFDDNSKEQALARGTVILSGGYDVKGNLILAIPTNKLATLTEWNPGNLSKVFLHLAVVAKYLKSKGIHLPASQALPLACLADLRNVSTLDIKLLMDSLESVEHQQRGTIEMVYFLKPRNKTKSHLLKKLLGVKPSKKRPRVRLFQVVLLKTLQELHTYIDVSQLTMDFCGALHYNHGSWMHLYRVVIKCIENCHDLLVKLPSVRDKVDLLQEYETDGHSSNKAQQLLTDLMEKFHIIISESTLLQCLTESKQSLFLLDHPSSDSQLSYVHPDLVKCLRSHLHDLFTELDSWNKVLEESWRITEGKLNILIQMHRHRERAKEIERKICEHYHPLLREHPIVGKTLSQAELYRAHFTTTLYDPAKELLSQATEILEAVQKLKNSVMSKPVAATTRQDSTSSGSASVFSGLDISDITQCLTTSIQPFTTQLQHLQQLYVNIHIFHLLFEKALIWYKKVLKFLPETLIQRCTTDSGQSTLDLAMYSLPPESRETLAYMPSEWLGAVRVFLSRHPPPRPEHIDRLDESIPQLVDRKIKGQSRSLALRLRLLQRILSSERVPLRLLTAVMAWRAELFGSSQQDRSPTSLHPTSPGKDRQKMGSSQSQAFFGSDAAEKSNTGQRDGQTLPAKSQPSRIHEKFSRGNRKVPGFDLDTPSRSKPTHLNLSRSTKGTSAMSEEVKEPEKSQARKIPPRTMSRSKSVEFNFNSSSTDGSVFDYEKALMHAESGPEMVKAKAAPRLPRKTRNLIKDVKPALRQGSDFKTDWTEKQAFSDPTDMQLYGHKTHHRGSEATKDSTQRDETWRRECKTDDITDGPVITRWDLWKNNHLAEPVPEPASSSSSFLHDYSNKQPMQSFERTSIYVDSEMMSPSGEERFIRVTFTPKQIKSGSATIFRFGSVDEQKVTDGCNHLEQDGESGTETAEGYDPYDNVVQRIREISASNLTNVEKLKKVSNLLSHSALKGCNSGISLEKLKANKMSVSTVDLRPRPNFSDSSEEEVNSRDFIVSHHGFQAVKEEKPIDAVLRMKKNLAKSMEELNISTTHTNQIFYHPAESKPSTLSRSREGFVSQLQIQPVFMNPEDFINRKTTVLTSGTENYSSSDVEMPRQRLSPGTERRQGQPHSWSDSDSISTGIIGSPDSPLPQMGRQNLRFDRFFDGVERDSVTEFVTAGGVPKYKLENAASEQYHVNKLPQESSNKGPINRPSSLSLFANRNFISPSFLRPATSMKDLTTKSQLTFNLVHDIDLEADYQALEDLEMLRTLQEDALSNKFSKYTLTSDIRKAQRMRVSQNVESHEKGENTLLSDSLRSSETASVTAVSLSERASYNDKKHGHNEGETVGSRNQEHFSGQDNLAENFATAVEQEDKSVPEIQIDRSPRIEDLEAGSEDEVSYLQAHESNFDRLTSEAEQEYVSQEKVAQSLRKTQKILQEEENRRHQGKQQSTDVSQEEEEDEEEREALQSRARRQLIQSTSVDCGYGSGISKLQSAHSTSSEGAGPDHEYLQGRDWRQLSSSSGDSATKSIWYRHGTTTSSQAGKKMLMS